MALYLIQHGKSFTEEEDRERSLTVEGISQVERIAQVAQGYSVQPTVIWHSGKKRAFQTAEIFSAALHPPEGLVATEGMNPKDDYKNFSRRLSPLGDIMVVGHLPFMERLASYLVTGSSDHPVFKFQNGGIVALDKEEESPFWSIKWALMPNIK